jgi:hypothetical protein
MQMKTTIKAGGLAPNHSQGGLTVRGSNPAGSASITTRRFESEPASRPRRYRGTVAAANGHPQLQQLVPRALFQVLHNLADRLRPIA